MAAMKPSPAARPSLVPPEPNDKLAALERHWRAMHPPAGLPGRQHFDPIDVPSLLPWILLVDVAREPLRFRYRVIGTAHVDTLGYNPTGRWFDEAHPDFHQTTVCREFTEVATRGEPTYYRGPLTFVATKGFLEIERLVLPLARNGRIVDMLLAIVVHQPVQR
jgi:hypothetical protein